MDFVIFASIVAVAYLSGALPFSVIIARVFGLADPRTVGSGNPGATNIARSNKAAAALTLCGDVGKGFLPVYLVNIFTDNMALVAAAGAAAVVGHVSSLFLRFGGGKGVATALGVFFGWHAAAGMVALLAWALMFALFRISSLSSIAAMLCAVVALWWWSPPLLAVVGGGVATLVIGRHHRNIVDLLRRREKKFGSG
ncbi:MAG: glycerol-3-phosphate 1-O-acyltransferase PlsY [Gammaproteobacteria bacterium WSBS_2016_MAG_OTU1]